MQIHTNFFVFPRCRPTSPGPRRSMRVEIADLDEAEEEGARSFHIQMEAAMEAEKRRATEDPMPVGQGSAAEETKQTTEG